MAKILITYDQFLKTTSDWEAFFYKLEVRDLSRSLHW